MLKQALAVCIVDPLGRPPARAKQTLITKHSSPIDTAITHYYSSIVVAYYCRS